MSGRGVLRIQEGGLLGFWCPGCLTMHSVNSGWTFNGDYDKPTFSPSVLVTYRHPKGHTNENAAPLGYAGEYVEDRCHSFVRDGKIEFLGDCTHSYAGQTIQLEQVGSTADNQSECRCIRDSGETRFNINCTIHGKAP